MPTSKSAAAEVICDPMAATVILGRDPADRHRYVH
jgi:hypothetical protein